jgi:hypothetical protein
MTPNTVDGALRSRLLYRNGNMKHHHSDTEICPDPTCFFHNPDNHKLWQDVIKAGKEAGAIKVHFTLVGEMLAGESVWAKPLDNNKAIINNIPFFASASIDDIVETSGEGFVREFVKVIQPMTDKMAIKYEANRNSENKPDEETVHRFKTLRDGFEELGFKTEGPMAGILVIAYPLTLTGQQADKQVKDTAKRLGIAVTVCE